MVHWPFLWEVLLRKGFDDRWVTRVMQLVSCGRTTVNINGEIGPYFPTLCGVRQGDPFSPFLLNMVVDALAIILDKAKVAGHIRDVGALNFNKSEVMILGYSMAEAQAIADRLNCRLGSFPTTYLGIPISDSCLIVADLRPTVTRMQHRVEPWKGRWLSKAARVILINSSLAGLLWFLMSFYSLHEMLHQEIAKYQSRFFWAGEGDKQKYHMAVIQLLPVLLIGTSISVGTGSSTLFWFDRWISDLPLAARFPELFAIAVDPPVSV
ncbi:uncharacterized protein [Aegilops tauschii subsp. strangulata]|uniref:uncharacterized protein n=1 Tax=Aegilops tauschii subsp. strangulata TaxID=200361 RepID=UPI003CC876B5